jgi:hypothetical protein
MFCIAASLAVLLQVPAMSNSKASRTSSGTRAGTDAIALLKADHRTVAGWFKAYEVTRSGTRKAKLAQQICSALKVHTQIEEEIFYPAFIAATRDKSMHHEAVVEHAGAKALIAQIAASGPWEEYFDAKVKVLSEQIKHHVKEEEQPGGMFAEARKSDMDLVLIGKRLRARKKELLAKAPPPRSLKVEVADALGMVAPV